jgi:hypothetical protein
MPADVVDSRRSSNRESYLPLENTPQYRDGYYEQALILPKQALYIARINRGLYHPSQNYIVDDIIAAEIALRNWQQVDDYYSYQEHLYRRLYTLHDPRLEAGLQKLSAWHINALNANLQGKRVVNRYQFSRHLAASVDNALHTLQATADYWNCAVVCCYKTFQCNQKYHS